MATDAAAALRGSLTVPGDKSISQRAVILAALAHGETRLRGYSNCADAAATLAAVGKLGAPIHNSAGDLVITGTGGVAVSLGNVDTGRSGTGMRLLAGALSSLGCNATLTGDPQLLARPMSRVATPLREMGADITLADGEHAPMTIRPANLHGITYTSPIASAQVKSALLLAGLHAQGPTTIVESRMTRDHTERLLQAMGAVLQITGESAFTVRIDPGALHPLNLTIPGDLSSAIFVIAAATLVPGSDVTVRHVGINPTRARILKVLQTMGARLEVEPVDPDAVEPMADIRVRHAGLRGIDLAPADVPMLIDELPLLALLATQAEGVTTFRQAGELRVKESDRLAGITAGLRALGAQLEEHPDGLSISGPTPLRGGVCDSLGDHRLAMTFAVAGLRTHEGVKVLGMSSAQDSFPGFAQALRSLGAAL